MVNILLQAGDVALGVEDLNVGTSLEFSDINF